MNTYEIKGTEYKALNEYEALKEAYRVADRIEMIGYLGNETWNYTVKFGLYHQIVTVKKISGGLPGAFLSIQEVELMRVEGEWHSLAIWGDTRNQTWIPSCLRVAA